MLLNGARDRRDARPATVRQAVDFIEANADIDITVTGIARAAYRWGFSSPSRFATYYRRACGVPPSQTLLN